MSEIVYKGITLEGEAVELSVRCSKIINRKKIDFDPDLPYLFPVLVDLQHNGALGTAYNNLREDSSEDLHKIAEHLIKNGVGRCLATFTTSPYDNLNKAAKALNKILNEDSFLNKLFFGIFHEGVFISPKEGWRGGHAPEYILEPDWEEFCKLQENSGGRVKMLNIAPEEKSAIEFIKKASETGVCIALGHCNPDTETIKAATDAGASIVTHFGNGAAPAIHRFQNPFWGFLDNSKLALGLIGDGFHLPPEVVRVALKCKGLDKCFFVSDANIYSGCKAGIYKRFGGLDCVIKENGFIHVVGQEILAGAWFQNNHSVEFLVNEVGIELNDAWKLCSTIPARLIGIELPMLNVGEEASFVQAKFENQKLKLQFTVLNGQKYSA